MKSRLALLCILTSVFLGQACKPSSGESTGVSFQETKVKAEKGDAKVQFNLGYMYANGEGVPKDYAEAVKWYRKAADQGHAEAQVNLGTMYTNGDGVEQDQKEAVNWYRKAADQGHAEAQFIMGVMYYKGRGVAKDNQEAYKWYLLAGAQGHDQAKEYIISFLERELTPQQKVDGQRLAREWKPKLPQKAP